MEVGSRYGRLTVINPRVGTDRWGSVQTLCACDCGNEKVVLRKGIKRGTTRSCGCLHREVVSEMGRARVTHGHSIGHNRSSTYLSWASAKLRCTNPAATGYENYGGRGITICDRWLNSFENFLADMGERPDGCSLDRIDNDGNYEPGNCRWSTRSEQALNRRKGLTRRFNGRVSRV